MLKISVMLTRIKTMSVMKVKSKMTEITTNNVKL